MTWLLTIFFVIRIIDADTLVLGDGYGNRERMRLYGVDAYELQTQKGQDAKAFMQRWLTGRQLTCSAPKGYSYQRTVRQCCHGGVDIAATLVNLNHAVSDPRYDKHGDYARPQGEYASTHCRIN